MRGVLIGLQAFQVAFLWLHDWLPLPPLNDVAAIRAADPLKKRVAVTLLQALPWSFGLAASLWSAVWPGWLWRWLWISYAVLFVGELRAWWWPYLLRAEPVRAARYRAMFGGTHSFLPERYGIRPNTLHVALHAATAATLVALAFSGG